MILSSDGVEKAILSVMIPTSDAFWILGPLASIAMIRYLIYGVLYETYLIEKSSHCHEVTHSGGVRFLNEGKALVV